MKLDTQQLRQIIQEEISRLHEAEARLSASEALTPLDVKRLGQLRKHTSACLQIMDGMVFWSDRKKPYLQDLRDACFAAHSAIEDLMDEIQPVEPVQDEPMSF